MPTNEQIHRGLRSGLEKFPCGWCNHWVEDHDGPTGCLYCICVMNVAHAEEYLRSPPPCGDYDCHPLQMHLPFDS